MVYTDECVGSGWILVDCVWFVVDSEEEFWVTVEGNMSGEVLDTFAEEVLGSKSTLKELLITLEND